jgi:transposase-like protein
MPHKSQDYKMDAVHYYLNVSHNGHETCRIFGCKSITLGRWVERYLAENTLERHNRQPCSYKVKQKHVDEALDYLGKHQTASILEVHLHLVNTFDDYTTTADHLSSANVRNTVTILKQDIVLKRIGKLIYERSMLSKMLIQ